MICYWNGQYLPEDQAFVSVRDRSYLYGDGLFETVLVWDHRLVLFKEHWERLLIGARLLNIQLAWSVEEVEEAGIQLSVKNNLRHGILRVHLSRGVGERGYDPGTAKHPTLSMTLHPFPMERVRSMDAWRLSLSSFRIDSRSPINPIKTANKLPNILAKAEATRCQANDAVFLNERNEIVETTCANIFFIRDRHLETPCASSGILPGITRKAVIALAMEQGWPVEEKPLPLDSLHAYQGAFATLTTFGVVAIRQIQDVPFPHHPWIPILHEGYWTHVTSQAEIF